MSSSQPYSLSQQSLPPGFKLLHKVDKRHGLIAVEIGPSQSSGNYCERTAAHEIWRPLPRIPPAHQPISATMYCSFAIIASLLALATHASPTHSPTCAPGSFRCGDHGSTIDLCNIYGKWQLAAKCRGPNTCLFDYATKAPRCS